MDRYRKCIGLADPILESLIKGPKLGFASIPDSVTGSGTARFPSRLPKVDAFRRDLPEALKMRHPGPEFVLNNPAFCWESYNIELTAMEFAITALEG